MPCHCEAVQCVREGDCGARGGGREGKEGENDCSQPRVQWKV